MVGWQHRRDRHEFEWLGELVMDSEALACCSPWDCKESDTSERLN